MTIATDESLFYLVVDVREGQPIYVFLGRDPASEGLHGDPVQLELLPPMSRFGRPGRPTFGRPVLGKARGSMSVFREFASAEDLWDAGFLPVSTYRVCDDWNDYHMPWSGSVQTQGEVKTRDDLLPEFLTSASETELQKHTRK